MESMSLKVHINWLLNNKHIDSQFCYNTAEAFLEITTLCKITQKSHISSGKKIGLGAQYSKTSLVRSKDGNLIKLAAHIYTFGGACQYIYEYYNKYSILS